MKMRFAVAASLIIICLTGCASIVDGVDQKVRVETSVSGQPVAGAECRMSSNKGTWFVVTPANTVVHRGFQDLAVLCTKNGLMPTNTFVASHVKGMAFGNILFGGAIGVIVDSGNGSAFDYPDLITIEMKPIEAGYVAPPVSSVPLPAKSPTSNAEMPTAKVAAPVTSAPARELRYQVTAERFARTTTCTARGQAILTTYGPGFEAYSIPCVAGNSLNVRCEFGECRAMP